MHNGAIMSSEVRHRVDSGPFPLVRLAGVLDARSAPTVRLLLLDQLAEQPEAMVVDVDELEVTERDAAAVLREVHRDTTDWPAARMVLCAGRDPGLWNETGWPVRTDAASAFATLGTPDPVRRVSMDLEPQVGAARRSRELISEACGRWNRPDLANSASIVVTEMVNNVVAHARTSMIVLLAVHDDGVSVAVRDHSATVPTFTGPPALTSYGGRGMLLIDSVSSQWGSLGLSDGKVVWATLTREPETPGRPAVSRTEQA
jgi:hypothetical protein